MISFEPSQAYPPNGFANVWDPIPVWYVPLETFDGGHLPAVGLDREERARLHGDPVEQDGAGAAVGGVTADVRARQAQLLA